jgi:Protein of unknown function (DUF2840)
MTAPIAASLHDNSTSRSHLTEVELLFDEGRTERWIRFGCPVDDRILDRQRRVLFFAPNSTFAFVRWHTNDFGTVQSRIDILRALTPHEASTSIGFMRPGGEILLRASSWPKVERVLQEIDVIERSGFDSADICPDHWRHVHNRLAAGQTPRVYTAERHALWLARRNIAS